MPDLSDLIPFAVVGIGAGLVLLWRGFGAFRAAGLIEGTSTSRIASIAAGEIRLSGTVEPAEVGLVSAVQSVACVYYRATVSVGRGPGEAASGGLDEERAIGFVVSDGSGSIRVFPRGAAWDIPWRFDAGDDWSGDPPPGLALRTGPAYADARPDTAAQITALLTVRETSGSDGGTSFESGWGLAHAEIGPLASRRPRHYREARIEPGDTVTVIGRAVPFGTLDDPAHADLAVTDRSDQWIDAEIAADVAAARASGTLAPDAETAWGNAAIPGFGIGRPVTEPLLDPAADHPALGSAHDAEEAVRTFTIEPETLVVVASTEVPLLISAGTPTVASGRQQDRFAIGLLGAILAIGSAIVLALGLAATLP